MAAEVAASSKATRNTVADGVRMKVWLGYLDRGLEGRVSFDATETEGLEIDVPFVTVGGDSGYRRSPAA